MCKAINQALVNMTENYDFLGKIGVDNIGTSAVEVRGTRRPTNRAERRKATAYAKNRRQALAKCADDIITNTGKVKDSGYRSYEKGDKAWSRKVRHQKFYDEYEDMFAEDVIDPITGEIIAEAGDVYFDVEFFDADNWAYLNEYVTRHPKHWDGETVTDIGNWCTEIWYDYKVYYKLWDAKTLIRQWEAITEAEKYRAELQAQIHALEKRIEGINADLKGMYMAHAKTLGEMNK